MLKGSRGSVRDSRQSNQHARRKATVRAPKIRPGGPVGSYPRIREAGAGGIGIRRRPPVVAEASQVRQRETGEVLDIRERQDHDVRVSIVEVLLKR